MTIEEKSKIMEEISKLLDGFVVSEKRVAKAPEPVEMLTIKECTEEVKGLSEHTVRKLIARGEIASLRTGEGKHGKFLVPKSSLIEYIRKIEA